MEFANYTVPVRVMKVHIWRSLEVFFFFFFFIKVYEKGKRTDYNNEPEILIQAKKKNVSPKMHARHVGRLGRVVRLSGTTTHKTPIWLQSLWNRGIAGEIKNQETLHKSGVLAGLATAILDSNSWNPHSVFLLALFAYCCYCCYCLPEPFMYMKIKLLMDCVTSFL